MSNFRITRVVTTLFGFANKKRERAYFDDRFYKSTYHDVAAAGVDAFEHFMTHGWREGRNPSRMFNTLYYRDMHLEGAEVNPLSHFVEAGGKTSRLAPIPPSEKDFVELQRTVIGESFDIEYYRLQIGDAHSQDLLTDYLTVGWKQGRSPNPTFDVTKYTAGHSFVKTLGVSPFYHFASQTRMYERKSLKDSFSSPGMEISNISRREIKAAIAKEFDSVYYLRRNEDVRNANLDPLSHFIDYGWRERRNPNAMFDTGYYRASNRDVAEADTNPFYHYLVVGRSEGRRANPVGTRLYPPMKAPSAQAWAEAAPAAATKDAEFIIIMPVYKGYDETLASIHAVLVAKQATKFALHVINDVTPDSVLDEALADLAGKGLFSYSKNEVNLGFVKSVNRGLRLFQYKEVILLNSDALVFGDWLDRFVAHARSDVSIATITPLSNNATICSYPTINDNNLIEPSCSAEILDRMAAACNKGRISDIPTGIGFCFYMSRASRDAVGILDEEAFGRGYGEENDFCLRAVKAGFRNVLAEDVFVYHAGQISFAEFAASEYDPGQKALLGKHPDYPVRLMQHLQADSSARARMRLDLYRLAQDAASNCIIFVYHALTGGIITHVKQMERRLAESGVPVVHIRVGASDRWSVVIESGSKTAPYCPNLWPTAFNQLRPRSRNSWAGSIPRPSMSTRWSDLTGPRRWAFSK
jgi:O-antigen biosynthesis protein